MVKKNYNFVPGNEEKIAKAFVSNARASLKYCTEYARELKGMRVEKAQRFLQNVIDKKEHLPLKKYNKNVGHRKGLARSGAKQGRYPINTSKIVLNLVNSVKANADYKGLDSDNLVIAHMFACCGFRRRGHQNQGRISGKVHLRKSTHLEIAVAEAK
ncbi:MAG TPA: 50S ribosomal protein L22 [archaeon]|nr:50S ribosomal protein L22 [archaeon]